VSRNELDAARAGAESAQALVRSAEKRLQLARAQLGYTELRTSNAGRIADVLVEVNENVSAGQPVVLLTAGSFLEVKVALPEILISRIQPRDTVTVTFDALPGRPFPARVTEVGVATTGTGTTYPVTVMVEEQDPNVRPGMAAEVAFRFTNPDKREHLLVPPVAVGEDRQGRFVFVVVPGEDGLGTTYRRAVKVGSLTENGLEILEGVDDGDIVVIAGVSRIADGQTVRLMVSAEGAP
jgi:RND family efflux transporter MFP subunit